jgi:hypothetical protein
MLFLVRRIIAATRHLQHPSQGLLLLLATAVIGCGSSDRVHVNGRIVRQDGSPVAGSRVTFRSPATGAWASGVTDNNGYYELGTEETGEGIAPGEYEVAVTEDQGDWDHPKPPTIHAKYTSPKTSGLSFTVEAGSDRSYDLELETPGGS